MRKSSFKKSSKRPMKIQMQLMKLMKLSRMEIGIVNTIINSGLCLFNRKTQGIKDQEQA